MIRLNEARHEAKRQRLIQEGTALTIEQDDLAKRTERLSSAKFIAGNALNGATDRLADLERQRQTLRDQAETERHELVRSRSQRRELDQQTGAARITVGSVAYDGVTVRVGNREAQLLSEPAIRPVFSG